MEFNPAQEWGRIAEAVEDVVRLGEEVHALVPGLDAQTGDPSSAPPQLDPTSAPSSAAESIAGAGAYEVVRSWAQESAGTLRAFDLLFLSHKEADEEIKLFEVTTLRRLLVELRRQFGPFLTRTNSVLGLTHPDYFRSSLSGANEVKLQFDGLLKILKIYAAVRELHEGGRPFGGAEDFGLVGRNATYMEDRSIEVCDELHKLASAAGALLDNLATQPPSAPGPPTGESSGGPPGPPG